MQNVDVYLRKSEEKMNESRGNLENFSQKGECPIRTRKWLIEMIFSINNIINAYEQDACVYV